MQFQYALVSAIKATSSPTPSQGRILNISNTDSSAMLSKGFFFASVEQTVRAKMGIAPADTVDWSGPCPAPAAVFRAAAGTIDWAAILTFLETLLPEILPLFGA